MTFNVYTDLPRELTTLERSAVAEALDAYVPGGGCVGRQHGPNDEVYFTVDAQSDDDARMQAARNMHTVLKECGLSIKFTITLQRSNQPYKSRRKSR